MKEKYYDDVKNVTNREICEYIYNDYIDGIELEETQKLLSKLPLLVDNNLACKISGTDDMMSSYVSGYRLASKFIQKYNKNIKDCRRELLPYEFGGENNTYARNDKRLVELAKYSLENGTYLAQIGKSDYCVLKVYSGDEKDEYIISYDLYFIGKKWRKWRKKFNSMVKEYENIKKGEKNEIITYTDGRPFTKAMFKPFDKVVFAGKEDVMKYVDNFVENIPNYYEFGMTPKLSIMLYGEPGTGKSTFARALARYLDIDRITSISPDYFNNDGDERGIGRRPRQSLGFCESIYVLDDIDCIATSRELDDSSENKKVTASLLSFLDNPPTFDFKAKDGVRYPISIVVASTNYYDKLDDAVKRYGRFDLKIEMNNFKKEQAQEMCDIYGLKLEDLVEDSNKKDFTISPSYLQALCLENLDNALKKVDGK